MILSLALGHIECPFCCSFCNSFSYVESFHCCRYVYGNSTHARLTSKVLKKMDWKEENLETYERGVCSSMRLRKWLEGRRKLGYAVLVLDFDSFFLNDFSCPSKVFFFTYCVICIEGRKLSLSMIVLSPDSCSPPATV
jgi:hypothetical protein